MVLASNQPMGNWGEVFGDAVLATAILDRLLNQSHVITFNGESYRLWKKRKRMDQTSHTYGSAGFVVQVAFLLVAAVAAGDGEEAPVFGEVG